MLGCNQRVRDLLGFTSLTMQIRCDIVDVLTGLRPTARLMLRPGPEAESCVRAVINGGMSVAVGRGVKWQPRQQVVGVVDWMGRGEAASGTAEKFVVLYIAKTQVLADSSRAADETRDDAAFGQALGYPPCCVRFVDDRGVVPEHKDVFSLYAIDGHYDPLCWPGAMAIDQSLLIHYPCSVSCAASRRLSEGRWNYIRQCGTSSVIELIRAAHALAYWLDSEGRVRAGTQVSEDAVAFASPSSALN
jgi:hypothetical protein